MAELYKLKPGRVVVSYTPPEKKQILPFAVTPVPKQILTVAKSVSWESVNRVVQIMPKLPNARLVVLGEGSEEQIIRELIASLNLGGRVELLGRVSKAETQYVRQQSSVEIINSTYEDRPDAFVTEVAVVATNIPGTTEAVTDGETGLLVPVGANDALVKAIERLLDNDSLRVKLIENAAKIIEQKFSWNAHLHTLINLFELPISK